jgi:hypothetical protein
MKRLIIIVTPIEQSKRSIDMAHLAAIRFQKNLVGYCGVHIQEEETKEEVNVGRDF